MIFPCENCIALPMCINRYKRLYEVNEKQFDISTSRSTISFYAILVLRKSCDLLNEYCKTIFSDPKSLFKEVFTYIDKVFIKNEQGEKRN